MKAHRGHVRSALCCTLTRNLHRACSQTVSLSPPGEATHSKCAALREGGGSWGQIIPLDLLMVSA